MKHYIIVKFRETVRDKAELCREISSLFREAEKIEGIRTVSLYPSVIDLPNRHDLMILLEMEKEALPVFDCSGLHLRWKKEFGGFLESKTIFDCE